MTSLATGDGAEHRVGNYILGEPIGEGGTATVFRAIHERLPRVVAIKILRPDLTGSPDIEEMFWREARLMSILEPISIPRVLDVGRAHDGRPYSIMELIDGLSLSHYAEQAIAPRALVRCCAEVAKVLADVHAMGYVHRDVKCENVMVSQSAETIDCKLVDFGIAIECGRRCRGAIVGTPRVMAPEQVRGELIDRRCDVWSLGVMLYELFSGTTPFANGGDVGQVFHRIQHAHPEPLPSWLPSPLRWLTEACLAKSPADRPQSMDEIVNVLCAISGVWKDHGDRLSGESATIVTGDAGLTGHAHC